MFNIGGKAPITINGQQSTMNATGLAANLASVPKQSIDFTKPALIAQQQHGGFVPVGPGTKVNPGGVSQVGSVFDVGSQVGTTALPSSIDFTLDNSDGVAAVDYLLFDASGFFAANAGGAYSAPTSASSGVEAIKTMTYGSQLVVKGYNYEVTNTTQFRNALKLTYGDADGTFMAKPIQNSQAKRNTQYVATLLTFETVIYLDLFRGLLLRVNAAEIVNISIFLSAGYGRQ